jgi:uncharacterized damage-inducible protein DinB
METTTQVISKQQILSHWVGHRSLTRKVIDKFPEKDFFEFSVGGMRPFAKLVTELLAMEAPGLKAIVDRNIEPFNEEPHTYTTKVAYLNAWDAATDTIIADWAGVDEGEFGEVFSLFGQYNFPVIQNILYFIDNEIHHRAQGYVYLRALGIEPPFFWDRY